MVELVMTLAELSAKVANIWFFLIGVFVTIIIAIGIALINK